MLALVFLLLSFYIWNCLIICKCYILGAVKGEYNSVLNFHSVSLSILERIIIDNRAYIMLALVFLLLSFYIWNCLIICKCYILGAVKGERNSFKFPFCNVSLSSACIATNCQF